MSDWIIILLIAGGVVFLVFSWWGVRRLRARHARSAVRDEPQGIAPERQRVAVILNPVKSRSAEARALIQRACLSAGWDGPRIYETTVEDPGYSQARDALSYGADVVLVGGGDGTVRAVAEVLAGTNTAMGLLPLGTGNLLARNIGLDLNDLRTNVEVALHGHQRYIDTARMRIENALTGEVSEHGFLVIAGIGMDAEVVSDTNAHLKKTVGWLAYTEAGVRHLPGRRKKVSIRLDGGPAQARKIRSVLFANCGLIPGGIDFIPQAMIDDGTLDVVVMSPRSFAGWLVMYFKIVLKHGGTLPYMAVYRSRRVDIECSEPMPTQLDGDPHGHATRVTVAVKPLSLLVRVKPVTADSAVAAGSGLQGVRKR